MSNLQLNAYYTELSSLNQTIESTLTQIEKTHSPKEANCLLSEVNKLISSASLILAKTYQLNNNNIPMMQNYYSKLESYRKTLSTLSTRIQLQLLSVMDDTHNQPQSNQKQQTQNQPIDLNLNTDYNESLLHGAVNNLHNIQQNLAETSANLKGQGEKIVNTVNVMEKGNHNVDQNSSTLNAMSCTRKCQKLSMIIVNVLLFCIILLLVMLKVLNYLR